MTAISECNEIDRLVDDYVARQLAGDERTAFDTHLAACGACRAKVKRFREVSNLLQDAFNPAEPVGSELSAKAGQWVNSVTPESVRGYAESCNGEWRSSSASRLGIWLSSAPWWFVSLSLHVLVVMLASLITMAIEMPRNDDAVIMITTLSPSATVRQDEDRPKAAESALDSKLETLPTDPTSKELSDVVVMLANAEHGDHFETINPDRPDTHGAFGIEEAKSFHSVEGSADKAGGGGQGGIGMEDVIGIGGAGSRGTGGGFGGGDGSGVGVGSGSGNGSFGQRNAAGRKLMVKSNGGSPATECAVDRGLEWLAKHQEADGHWDTFRYGGHDTANQGKTAQATVDCAMTGLALLAFLGAGHTEKIGRYKENVVRGLKWLKSVQDYESGMYNKYNYAHAIAGMAMAEAAGMGRIGETIESAQKAVEATCAAGKKYATSDRGGWRYMTEQLSGVEGGDMSNSGWAMMFLKSAKVANLKIPHESLEGVNAFLNACERGKVAGDSYSGQKYSYSPAGKDDTHRGYIAILGRLFFGTPANEVEGGVRYMLDEWKLPPANRPQNLYYDYYMTLITFQVGGNMWQEWNEALKNALPPTQVKGGDNDGSWEPNDVHGKCWGRVGSTALSILCMEVYYRYKKLSQP